MAGVMLRGGPGGVVLLPRLVSLASAPLVPASPKSDRMRRSELERELGVFSDPAQRRLAIQAMTTGFRSPDGIKCRVQPGWHRFPS